MSLSEMSQQEIDDNYMTRQEIRDSELADIGDIEDIEDGIKINPFVNYSISLSNVEYTKVINS